VESLTPRPGIREHNRGIADTAKHFHHGNLHDFWKSEKVQRVEPMLVVER
jgi:hypothetical protein